MSGKSDIKYVGHENLHPFLKAMLAYNDYDYSDDPTNISTTSLMKPTHMVALERFNKDTSKEINLEGMIPSVMGNAMHSLLENALDATDEATWKQFGIPKPEKLEVRQEERVIRTAKGYTVTGKFDMLYMYDGSEWHLADLKTMSVWALMIDPIKKKEEFIKQLSIYRWLNHDKDIADRAEILYWYTDWSKMDSIRQAGRGYPQSRIGHLEISLWSLDVTEKYVHDQLTALIAATKSLETKGVTGTKCSEVELWKTENTFKYYKNPKKTDRATKNFDNYNDAHARYMKDGSIGTVIEVSGEIKRCKYCSVTAFCPDYATYKALGYIKE